MTRALLVLVIVAMLLALIGTASASTVSPVGPPSSGGSGCQTSGLFGHIAPDGNALIGVQYPDPLTGEMCILEDGGLLPGDQLEITLFTPNQPSNGTVPIGVEEFTWGTETIGEPGPNGTVIPVQVSVQQDVVWSNATVGAVAGQFQQFYLDVPPVFVTPSNAENLTISILGLELAYLIATPGTSLPIAETLGGLIGWLALMSPAAVISFVGGFGPGAALVSRMRYVSTARWAAALVLLATIIEVGAIAGNFTSFLYWLGSVGILGLAVLLLLPLFAWGAVFWIAVRGRRLKYRLVRAPIAKSKEGEPVAGVAAVKIFGGGGTGHAEELVDGLGVGGISGAWNRLLGLRVWWKPTKVTTDPRIVHYEWQEGSLAIEGEYPTWPVQDGKKLDFSLLQPAKIWFPWRKKVRAELDPLPDGAPAPPGNDGVRDPALWAHRGFFLGLRHGEAKLGALGSPDHVGPDSYIRGVAPAAAFGRESQRRGTALVLLSDQVDALAEKKALEMNAIHDRMEAFPHSPEALEGARALSTRVIHSLFDPTEFLARLEEKGRLRVDYKPPGASKWSTEVRPEAAEPRPPELRGKPERGT